MTISEEFSGMSQFARNVHWRKLFKLQAHGSPHDPLYTVLDVSRHLKIANPYVSIGKWTQEETNQRIVTLIIADKTGRTRPTKLFTENGLMHFVFKGKTAEAKKVQAEMVRAAEEYRRKHVISTAEIALDMGADISIKHYHPGLFERHPVVLWFHWYALWRDERDVPGLKLGTAIILFCEFYERWTAGQRYIGLDGQKWEDARHLFDLAFEADVARDGAPIKLPTTVDEAWNLIRRAGFAPRLDIKTPGEMEERLDSRLLNTNAEAYNEHALLARENSYFMHSDTPEGKRELERWLAHNSAREADFKVPQMPWNAPWWGETVLRMGGNGDMPAGRGTICAKGVAKEFGVPVYKLRELARPGGNLKAARPWAIMDSHGHLRHVAEWALLEIAEGLAPRFGEGQPAPGAKSFVDAEWQWTVKH